MIEVEPSPAEEDASAAPMTVRHDFSAVRGFQVVAAEDRAAGQKQGGDEAWREALRAELEARAARFHQAVDAAIVLSNDGIIRWLGDPVGRLALGPNALTPGAVILADDALPAASQELVKNRVDLWLVATARRLLAPLFALEAMQEGSAVVRGLAGKLARSLGILEREPIRREIKALAQDDRAELRKHGVRFGAYYIFVPALIKPAPRTFAIHLWSLQAPTRGDADMPMRALGPLASSGRTSLPFDAEISTEAYRMAGYRPCGERIVRVDVVERLAGIIRAALVEGAAGGAAGLSGQRKSKGFVVSGQMTSLTGCSGEPFASILRSMGFESVQMMRSDFFAPSGVSESTEEREPLAPAETAAPAVEEQTAPPSACGEGTPVTDLFADPGPALPEEGVLDNDSPPDAAAEALRPDVSPAEPGAESGASSGGAKNDEAIVVWRPEKRPPAHRGGERRTEPNRSKLAPGELGLGAGRSNNDSRPSKRMRNRNRAEAPSATAEADAGKAAEGPGPRANRSDRVGGHERHRQTAISRDMPRSHPGQGPKPRVKVDPDSPFAKLLELRSLLEGQANKRP
jgi:ATP-dependent RNA helicase SUPV3L1/SUV3